MRGARSRGHQGLVQRACRGRAAARRLRWVPEYEAYVLEQWRHGDFDDYWKQVGIYAEGFYDQLARTSRSR